MAKHFTEKDHNLKHLKVVSGEILNRDSLFNGRFMKEKWIEQLNTRVLNGLNRQTHAYA